MGWGISLKRTIQLSILNKVNVGWKAHIYSGRYPYVEKILYTLDKGFIYEGRYNYFEKILYTIEGNIPLPLIMLFQLGLI